MIRVTLINPSIDFMKFGKFKSLLEPMPCIGLAYLAAILEKEKFDVMVIDDFVLRKGESFLKKIIADSAPDVLGISCLTPSAPICYSIGKWARGKGIKVIMGNVHAALFSEEILKNGYADAVIHGEGEEVITDVIMGILEGNLENINGISFVRNSEIVHTERRNQLMDLDSLPFPAWHLFPYKKYGLLPFADIKKPILTVLSSRGCPFECTYCSLRYFGRRYRKRKPERVVDEIEYLIDRFSVKQFGFVDGIFPLDKEHCLEFCKEMVKRGVNRKVVWTTETRADLLDRDLLEGMKEAGLRRIIFGIESGVEELLKNVKKFQNLNKVRETVRLCKKMGIETIGLFMLGLPGEKREDTLKTISFAIDLDLDFAKFAITVPFPGSELYDGMVKSGKLCRNDWENFTTFNPDPEKLVKCTDFISSEELLFLQKKASRDFYLRSKMILRQLLKIRTVTPSYILKGIKSLLSR